MKQSVMKWAVVGEVLVAHTTEGAVPDETWNSFVKDIETKPVRKFVGASTGATEVSSTQRKTASAALSAKKVSSFVITDDRLVRGVATAASWLGVDIKSFSWAELDKCIKHLGIDAETGHQVAATLNRLKTACLAAATSDRGGSIG